MLLHVCSTLHYVASFPVPRSAFHRLQYGKAGRAWYISCMLFNHLYIQCSVSMTVVPRSDEKLGVGLGTRLHIMLMQSLMQRLYMYVMLTVLPCSLAMWEERKRSLSSHMAWERGYIWPSLFWPLLPCTWS